MAYLLNKVMLEVMLGLMSQPWAGALEWHIAAYLLNKVMLEVTLGLMIETLRPPKPFRPQTPKVGQPNSKCSDLQRSTSFSP